MAKQILETVKFSSKMTDEMMNIEQDETKNHLEKRVEMCNIVLSAIGNMKGKDLERHLTEVSIDTNDGGLFIGLKFLPD